ncbi:MAG: BspA family leucine-rich repeat surface protein [Lentilactobacillus diolivorans]|nr:BspA family leucine-rich repeat surface protein [Lentilactobacillus diolivorans]
MIRKSAYWLFAAIAVLSLNIGIYTQSQNVHAAATKQVQQVRSSKQSPKMVSSQAATANESGQIEDVKYSIDNDTLTLGGGTLSMAHDYPWAVDNTITNIRIIGPLILKGNAGKGLFDDMESLTKISNLEDINTKDVTDMSYMFRKDMELTSLDLASFDTSNVKDMGSMFAFATGLTNLNISGFDTSKVTNMKHMFLGDGSLSNLDVTSFNTSNVKDMGSMFAGDGELTSLDLSNFNTSNVTDMGMMFAYDSMLTNLDLSNFDTSNMTSMSGMFWQDANLTSLDLSNFDTSKVTDMEGVFLEDTRLWILRLGPKSFSQGITEITGMPSHSPTSVIPDSNPIRYASGPGWQAVNAKNGGAVDNPRGTVYDSYLTNRPAETETYVWQQDSKPIVIVEYIDAATGKEIPGVESKTISDFQGKEYDVSTANFQPDISGYTWDGKIPTNAKGVYGDKDIVVQYVYKKNSTPSTPGTPTNPSTDNSQTVTSSTSSSSPASSSSSSAPITTPKPSTSVGPNIAVKGEAVYGVKKIGLYKSTSFTKKKRITWYPKQKRVNRPMFVVTGYKRTSNGTLRYKVRDVNHGRKTAGKTGYITASRKYVVPVYYASVPKSKKITVISKKGVNAYKSANLTGKVKHYKKGIRLTVKKLVKHNLTTRYQLSNGNYITANKKLIIAGNY